MNMQQMLQNVKKMQREYEKAHKQLEEETFEGTSSGIVKVLVKGNLKIEKVEFLDPSCLTPDDKEMIEEAIQLAFNNAKEKIDKKEEELYAKFQQQPGGMFF